MDLSTFRPANTPQKWAFQVLKSYLNTCYETPKQLWKSPENDFFDPNIVKKLLLKTAKMSKLVIKNFDFGDFLSTFRAQNTPKGRPFKAKNNIQTLPKQLQNNFEKVQKSTFLTSKMVKNDPSNWPKGAKFWPKISVFKVIYRPLKLKIHPKVGPLRPKTKPKHFLNKS